MPGVEGLAEAIVERIARRCADLGLPVPQVAAEPGRSIVGNSGVTLYRVGDRRVLGDGRTAIAVDGGCRQHQPSLRRAVRGLANRASAAAVGTVTIVGRHCESGDVLPTPRLPGDVGPGDLLAFAATGAYTHPLASSGQVGRPEVVAVEDGRPMLCSGARTRGISIVRRPPLAGCHAKPLGSCSGLPNPATPAVPVVLARDRRRGGYVRRKGNTPTCVSARFRGSGQTAKRGGRARRWRVVGHVRPARGPSRHATCGPRWYRHGRRPPGSRMAHADGRSPLGAQRGVEKVVLSVYPRNHARSPCTGGSLWRRGSSWTLPKSSATRTIPMSVWMERTEGMTSRPCVGLCFGAIEPP
jgi:hypothetical protein